MVMVNGQFLLILSSSPQYPYSTAAINLSFTIKNLNLAENKLFAKFLC